MMKLRKRLKVGPILEQHKNSSSFKLVEVREYSKLMSGSTRKNVGLLVLRTFVY